MENSGVHLVVITTETFEALRAISEAQSVPVADLLTQALTEFITKNESVKPEEGPRLLLEDTHGRATH